MEKIKYIAWNYLRTDDGIMLHLIRFENGLTKFLTSEQMVAAGLADWHKALNKLQ